MVFDALLNALTSYNAQPTNTHEAIMDAARAYIGAQGFKETGEFVLGMPRRRLEEEQIKLKNALMRRQLAQLPYDSDDLEQEWNEDGFIPSTFKIAKMLGTRYLESETNPLYKVGKYANPRTGSGLSAFAAKFLG